MKTILVPTDFSSNAENALHFALILAKNQNAKLILMHVYQFPIAVAAVSFNVLEEEKQNIKLDSSKKLRAACIKIDHAGGIPYEYLSEEGDTVDTILRAIEEKEIDLIVMGTKGASGLAGIVFGSTTSHVLEKATCPVMAIPEASKFNTTIKKITYATDYRQSDLGAIQKLIEIATVFKAQINILHVSGDEITAEEEIKLMDAFRKKVNTSVFYNNLSFQLLHGQNVEEELEKYIADGSTDILVMATHSRSFIDRLFERSITKELVEDISVPLIAFHYKKKHPIKIF